ncbi:ribonuclease P protein component 1 [Infirmifilum lucidum]|uniref:Ribonuclease P protein component 1 n=1 Tax=Infirmifilum lucidum TaxID=2776706 RepID=A0A7L9FEH7_9CREN|nr:ribonuclease P protein component 1 [Infirmifilum lucidum]QOJ78208.1 ribonuclease P protein component 1 [Infirmifilum lucidum]
MRVNPRNILRHELIGLQAEVVEARNPYLVGIRGIVLDETKNTLVIGEPGGGRKTVLKFQAVFRFILPDGTKVLVDGKYLVGRPEERLKKLYHRW